MEIFWQEVVANASAQGHGLLLLLGGMLGVTVIGGILAATIVVVGEAAGKLHSFLRKRGVYAWVSRKVRQGVSILQRGLVLLTRLLPIGAAVGLVLGGGWWSWLLFFGGRLKDIPLLNQPDALVHIAAFFVPTAMVVLVLMIVGWLWTLGERRTEKGKLPSTKRLVLEGLTVLYLSVWVIPPAGWAFLFMMAQD